MTANSCEITQLTALYVKHCVKSECFLFGSLVLLVDNNEHRTHTEPRTLSALYAFQYICYTLFCPGYFSFPSVSIDYLFVNINVYFLPYLVFSNHSRAAVVSINIFYLMISFYEKRRKKENKGEIGNKHTNTQS